MKKRKRVFLALVALLMLCSFLIVSCAKANREDGMYPSDVGGEMSNGSTSKPGSPTDAATGEFEKKIIYTSNVTAETKDFETAVSEIEAAVSACGGYVQSSNVTGQSLNSYGSGSRRATYTIRVPVDQYESFLSDFGSLVNVTNSYRTSDDITTKYYDLEVRIKTLEAERDSLTKMLEESTDLDYMLKVQDRLYDVIYEIESYTATLKQYELLTDYATVNITLYEVVEYTPADEGPGYFERLGQSFKRGWRNFAEGCADFSVWFVGAIPTLLMLGLVALVVVLIVRKTRRRKGKKAAPTDTQNK